MLAARGTILITNNNTGTYVTGGLPPAPTHAKSKLDEELAATTDHKDRARAILEEMNQFLNITTDLANGGTYRASAERDRTVASWLRIVAFCLYGAAAVVAGCLFIWSNNNPPESWEWLPKFLIGGPVLLLVWAAVYASRESSEHRNSSRLFQHQSLAFVSLDKYAARIARPTGTEDPSIDSATKSAEFLYDISKSLFTNQIDAHVEQIKAQGRADKISLKRGTWRNPNAE